MGFLDRLLGRQSDPTADWPPAAKALPDLVPEEKRMGPLRFGDLLQSARQLGKPARVSRIAHGTTALFYQAGFRLDFSVHGFCYVALILEDADGEAGVSVASESQAQIKLRDRAAIEERYGTPHKTNQDDEESILFYFLNGCCMEFELDPSGSLKRWNLFPQKNLHLD